MTTTQANIERSRMWHFQALDPDQQHQAMRRMALAGQTEQTIARATGLSVEMIRRLLAIQDRADPVP